MAAKARASLRGDRLLEAAQDCSAGPQAGADRNSTQFSLDDPAGWRMMRVTGKERMQMFRLTIQNSLVRRCTVAVRKRGARPEALGM